MPSKNSIICGAVPPPDLQPQYCAACQSALYCFRACQRIDWKKQHKQICKLVNVGHGSMQIRSDIHTSRSSIKLNQPLWHDTNKVLEEVFTILYVHVRTGRMTHAGAGGLRLLLRTVVIVPRICIL
jgi:hypothetical protein